MSTSAFYGALVSLVMAAACASIQAQSFVSVGPNVQVSAGRPNVVHSEVTIAADRTNPNLLIACAAALWQERGQVFDMVYASRDRGATWTPVLDLAGDPHGDVSQPFLVDVDCAFGRNGDAYFVSQGGRAAEGGPLQGWLFRSPDGGRTWPQKTVVLDVRDRPFIAIDRTNGPFGGRLYLSYTGDFPAIDAGTSRTEYDARNATGFSLQLSRDSGKTFNLSAQRAALPGTHVVHAYPTFNVVLSDGTLIVPVMHLKTPGYHEGSLKVFRSTTGGISLEPPVTVTDLVLSHEHPMTSFLPSVAADPGSAAFRDRLYVAWADSRRGRAEIWFTASVDKGRSWNTPRVISDDTTHTGGRGPNDFLPAIAVNKDGVVGVSWYDRRDNPDDGWYVRFSASLDGGETWTPSVRVAERPQAPAQARRWAFWDSGGPAKPSVGRAALFVQRQGQELHPGHHSGLTADADGVFHPAWVDNRTGLPQLWTASVTVAGQAALHGGGELATMTDVTSKVILEMVGASHDSATNIVAVTVRLRNRSTDTIRGPVKVRAISLSSKLGPVSIVDAANHVAGPGAVWDFSDVLHANTLPPKAATAERTFRVRIRGAPKGGRTEASVLALEAVILAGAGR